MRTICRVATFFVTVALIVYFLATKDGQHIVFCFLHGNLVEMFYLLYGHLYTSVFIMETVLLVWWFPQKHTCLCGFWTYSSKRAISHMKADHKTVVQG